jgi:hypothetical protein
MALLRLLIRRKRGVVLTKLLNKTRGLQIYLLITIPAFLISQTMTRVVVVRPRLQLSQVSAISAMQIWYWVLVFCSIFIFIWAKKQIQFECRKISYLYFVFWNFFKHNFCDCSK